METREPRLRASFHLEGNLSSLRVEDAQVPEVDKRVADDYDHSAGRVEKVLMRGRDVSGRVRVGDTDEGQVNWNHRPAEGGEPFPMGGSGGYYYACNFCNPFSILPSQKKYALIGVRHLRIGKQTVDHLFGNDYFLHGQFSALQTGSDCSYVIGDYPVAVRHLHAVSLRMELHPKKWKSCVLHSANFARSAPR